VFGVQLYFGRELILGLRIIESLDDKYIYIDYIGGDKAILVGALIGNPYAAGNFVVTQFGEVILEC